MQPRGSQVCTCYRKSQTGAFGDRLLRKEGTGPRATRTRAPRSRGAKVGEAARHPVRPPVPAALTQARGRTAQSAAGSEPGSAQQRGPAPPPPLLIILLPPKGRRRHGLARGSRTSGSRSGSLANAPAGPPHNLLSGFLPGVGSRAVLLGMRRAPGSALALRWPVRGKITTLRLQFVPSAPAAGSQDSNSRGQTLPCFFCLFVYFTSFLIFFFYRH